MLGRLSLALKYLLPVMTVVTVTVVALVLFSNAQFHTQQEVMASEAAETSLRLLTESLEFSMALGAKDFDPLLSSLGFPMRAASGTCVWWPLPSSE